VYGRFGGSMRSGGLVSGRVDLLERQIENLLQIDMICALASLDSLFPNRFSIVRKLRPFKECASIFPWDISRVAHPKVLSPILLLSLHHPQNRRDVASTFRRELRMQRSSVVPISDIDPLILSNRVRVNGLSRSNAVFPLFLHFRVHDE